MVRAKYLSLFLFFIAFSIFSMDRNKELDTKQLTVIKSVKDIKPFVGRVIAYKALSPFINKPNRYLLSENHEYKYGIVNGYSSEYNMGFIDSLIKKGHASCLNFLTDSNVAEGLEVRTATLEETAAIKQAILSDKAAFECKGKEKALTFFE